MMSLKEVHAKLAELAATPSRNEKKEILGEALDLNSPNYVDQLQNVIELALNPFLHFNISRIKYVRDPYKEGEWSPFPLYNFLLELAEADGASNNDRKKLSALASCDPETVAVVNFILKKDLRCGISTKTVNEFLDIPSYEVMKPYGDNPFPGKNFEKFLSLAEEQSNFILWSIKADGYRISYAIVQEDGSIEYLSTNGKPYNNFKVFDAELFSIACDLRDTYGINFPMKFDGECVSTDGDFQTMQKQARRKTNADTDVYRFLVWDVISDSLPLGYFDRYTMLFDTVKPITTGETYDFSDKIKQFKNNKIFVLKHSILPLEEATEDRIRAMALSAISLGNEGVILKTPYHMHEFERSNHWFRIKALYLKGSGIEVDLPVVGFEYGREGTRLEKLLGKFLCQYKDKIVKVSGKISDKQREEFVKDLPSVIEVYADSETNDGSLRLPIFQRVRVDK
jgi:ATP-dependent DNA ligase